MSSKKHYELRKPRYAGGIRLQEARGTAARSWWANRWLEAIGEKSLGNRFGRGRAYAMSGQVTRIEETPGGIAADVLGVRPDPYRVTVAFRAPSVEARERIVAKLRAEPMLVARLLADDLPTEVESIFRAEGMSLFPGGKLAPDTYDMTTSCTCPDYANPCKHSFAALLILGEEIARHPAKLLALRSIDLDKCIVS